MDRARERIKQIVKNYDRLYAEYYPQELENVAESLMNIMYDEIAYNIELRNLYKDVEKEDIALANEGIEDWSRMLEEEDNA